MGIWDIHAMFSWVETPTTNILVQYGSQTATIRSRNSGPSLTESMASQLFRFVACSNAGRWVPDATEIEKKMTHHFGGVEFANA